MGTPLLLVLAAATLVHSASGASDVEPVQQRTAYASLLSGPADFTQAARVLGYSIRQTTQRHVLAGLCAAPARSDACARQNGCWAPEEGVAE